MFSKCFSTCLYGGFDEGCYGGLCSEAWTCAWEEFWGIEFIIILFSFSSILP